jgi:adenylate cyclase
VLFRQGMLVGVAEPIAGVGLIALLATTVALAIEGREKANLRMAFGQYVSSGLVEKILDDPGQVRLGGERRPLTVLFSDIRGFSSFSERMQPENLSSFLNEYLSPMTHLVLQQGGMLDKYIGDAVMAVYGAPLPQADHAAAACRTALQMQQEIARLNIAWRARGLPDIQVGIGINTGEMSVGNMGSDVRFDYTVMGDAVNLASRLEGLTKEVGCAILCGPDVPAAVGDGFVFRELDRVRVKGRGGSVQVYELVGTRGQARLDATALVAYAAVLESYRERDFATARAGLQAFVAAHADDPAAAKLLARIDVMAQDPPGPGWDGVYDQKNK